MKRVISLCSLSLMFMTALAVFFFGWEQQPVAGQVAGGGEGFADFRLDVWCDPMRAPQAFSMKGTGTMGTGWVCAGNCQGKFVSLADALRRFPARVSEGLTEQVTAYEQTADAGKIACLRDGGKDKPPENKNAKCESPSRIPTSPWLDPDVPCGKRERGVVSWKHNLGTRNLDYTVKLCGETINYKLINGAGSGNERRQPGARSFYVCCESWLSALNSKSPCDVRKDTDCDGEINEADRFPDIPLDTRIGRDFFVMNARPWPADAGDQLRPPWRYLHAPDQSECKDCKWELIGYEFTSKQIPDMGMSSYGDTYMDTEYRFKTTWKCPASGQTKENYEVVITSPRPRGSSGQSTPPG